jgi:hypothetical protein
MSALYLPEGYRQQKRVVKRWGVASTGEVSKNGTVTQIEHWDGSMDAVVKPKPFGVKLKRVAEGSPAHLKAMQELEAALKELRVAERAGDAVWQQRARRRVEKAQQQAIDTQ